MDVLDLEADRPTDPPSKSQPAPAKENNTNDYSTVEYLSQKVMNQVLRSPLRTALPSSSPCFLFLGERARARTKASRRSSSIIKVTRKGMLRVCIIPSTHYSAEVSFVTVVVYSTGPPLLRTGQDSTGVRPFTYVSGQLLLVSNQTKVLSSSACMSVSVALDQKEKGQPPEFKLISVYLLLGRFFFFPYDRWTDGTVCPVQYLRDNLTENGELCHRSTRCSTMMATGRSVNPHLLPVPA